MSTNKQAIFNMPEHALEAIKAICYLPDGMEVIKGICDMPEHAKKAIKKAQAKLAEFDFESSQYDNAKNHLEWLTSLPWGKTSKDNEDVKIMRQVLDEDIFGMKDVKKRIMNFLACEQYKNGKILLFSGPSGVGKTAMAKTIARALGREFCDFSVGMLKDDAAIKGQHREDCGAMPGKLIQCLRKAKTENPVIAIDDITDMESDGYGIGAGIDGLVHALFEALNQEQNSNFVDRFIEVPVDLSNVLFILTTTADLQNIITQGHWEGRLGPLKKRVVQIEFSGYASEEKIKIAREHLIPKWQGKCDLMEDKLEVKDEAIRTLFKSYCYEAGVHELDERLEQIYKVAKKSLENGEVKELPLLVSSEKLCDYFGPTMFHKQKLIEKEKTPPGMIMLLSSSYSFGGNIRCIEADLDTGSTESLKMVNIKDDETKVSIETAYLVAKKLLMRYDPGNDFFDQSHVRIQFLDHAIGGSGGTSIVSLFLSLALNLPIHGIAMTGAISAKGMVLRIGGIKEKLDAAKSAGIELLILPEANKEDYENLEEFIKEGINVEFASDYDQIFQLIFPNFKPKCAKENNK